MISDPEKHVSYCDFEYSAHCICPNLAPFVEVPNEHLHAYYLQQTMAKGTNYAEKFFKAILEGRVSLRQEHRGGTWRVIVSGGVQDDQGPTGQLEIEEN